MFSFDTTHVRVRSLHSVNDSLERRIASPTGITDKELDQYEYEGNKIEENIKNESRCKYILTRQ